MNEKEIKTYVKKHLVSDAQMSAGALHRARRIIGSQIGQVRKYKMGDQNVRALDEAYRLLGIVMDRIDPKGGR